MQAKRRYDSLIQWYAHKFGLDPAMVTRQVEAESSFRPQVASVDGAVGLMQILPSTFGWAVAEMRKEGHIAPDHEVWIKNPEDSLQVGCWYDQWLYGKYEEVPDPAERWRFALAAYNCGRANLNAALAIARQAVGHPASYSEWRRSGSPSGVWQTWRFVASVLPLITGDRASETVRYVAKIMPEQTKEVSLQP